ncbi:MAG: hypothetical protein H0X13_17085 [Ramlibacter sp.]|nr:hypothetical protein [Ramlibacter sp.]
MRSGNPEVIVDGVGSSLFSSGNDINGALATQVGKQVGRAADEGEQLGVVDAAGLFVVRAGHHHGEGRVRGLALRGGVEDVVDAAAGQALLQRHLCLEVGYVVQGAQWFRGQSLHAGLLAIFEAELIMVRPARRAQGAGIRVAA